MLFPRALEPLWQPESLTADGIFGIAPPPNIEVATNFLAGGSRCKKIAIVAERSHYQADRYRVLALWRPIDSASCQSGKAPVAPLGGEAQPVARQAAPVLNPALLDTARPTSALDPIAT